MTGVFIGSAGVGKYTRLDGQPIAGNGGEGHSSPRR